MAKNIIVFADGTGKEGGERPSTNIYKLFNMVLDRSPEQIAFYDRGLGTGWRKLAGNVAGAGISRNIQECYRFIFDNYMSGDQIYLFGFSRGATTVRSLASFIHLFGILPKSRSELIAKAYGIYTVKDAEKRKKQADEFVAKHHTMWTKVKFLGVWDTVAALGIPLKPIDVIVDRIPFYRHRYHDLRLAKSVENAYHALAIDDERLVFHPKLFDAKLAGHQSMKQVWFCGMHTDVGGGYPEQQLSDIALEWMVKQATAHGLKLYPEHKVRIDGDPNGMMHDSRGGTFSRYYRHAVRSWDPKTHGRPTIHESVLKRTLNPHNGTNPPYKPWVLDGSLDYDVEPWERL